MVVTTRMFYIKDSRVEGEFSEKEANVYQNNRPLRELRRPIWNARQERVSPKWLKLKALISILRSHART